MRRLGRWRHLLWLMPLATTVALGLHHVTKVLPPGLATRFAPAPATEVAFLADVTYVDAQGRRHVEQHIFDEMLRLIAEAPSYVLADQFLFNDLQGAEPETTRALSRKLTDALVARARALPKAQVALITDPINRIYGARVSPELERLRAAGVTVVETDLRRLRDSNPLWSAPWRLLVAPWGPPEPSGGRWPNPFAPEGAGVPLRSWMALLNFKANHRKTLVVDRPGPTGTLATLVSSANPHDASSAHGNVALRATGPVARAVAESERAVAAFSGVTLPPPPERDPAVASPTHRRDTADPTSADASDDVRVGLVTESAIQAAVLDALARTSTGDLVDVAMFYLSDREVIAGLKAASARGARLRLLLDPNKDAFGRTKNGVPNRPVAHELRHAAQIRWCATHGEQCHAKLVLVRPAAGHAELLLGSANLTRRNLDDYNLESNLVVHAPADAPPIADAVQWFEDLWHNEPNRITSASYDAWAESSLAKRLLYHVMERLGLSTF